MSTKQPSSTVFLAPRHSAFLLSILLTVSDVVLALHPNPSSATNVSGPEQHTPHRSMEPVKVHAWSMYISTGFLLPLGILVARFMRIARKDTHRSLRALQLIYYLHLTIQIIGVFVFTGGAAYSFKRWGFGLDHTHQKLGMSLWIIMWVQPFIGFLRPNHGAKGRRMWYAIHWLLGTGALILCIFNLYVGISIWERITRSSVRSLNIAFSVQVAAMAFVYLMQDRWDYIVEQGIPVTKPIAPPPSNSLSPIAYSMVPNSMELQMRHYFPV
ncbi:hypothetical protein KP509_07G048000 [Ceratopteris richardii]|uniref:Cytochrome b561 domain-containing protein n=1 Tax=Ceratopteris richardii TaxID=49495 RepID=A0A8T2UC30_CERRI|nr:hypothetical protein KP509_07G048000 [Ceratopteris richardii]